MVAWSPYEASCHFGCPSMPRSKSSSELSAHGGRFHGGHLFQIKGARFRAQVLIDRPWCQNIKTMFSFYILNSHSLGANFYHKRLNLLLMNNDFHGGKYKGLSGCLTHCFEKFVAKNPELKD